LSAEPATGAAALAYRVVPLLAALALVLALRLVGLPEQSLTADEYVTAIFVPDASLAEYAPLNAYRVPDNLPVYFTTLFYWEKVFGPSARAFSILCALLTAVLIYRLGLRVFSPFAGILAVLFFALSPLNIFHGQAVRPYALYTLLAVASLCLVARAASSPPSKRLLFASIFVNVLMVYTHLIGGILLAVEGIFLLWVWRRDFKSILFWTLPQLLLVLPALAFLQIPETDPYYPPMTLGRAVLNTFHSDSPVNSVELIPSRDNWGFTVTGYDTYRYASIAASWCMGAASLAAIALAFRTRRRSIALLLLAFLLPSFLLYFVSMVVDPISLPRYTLFTHAARYLLVAGVLAALPITWLRWAGAGVLLALMALQVAGMLPHGARPETIRAGDYIREHATANDFMVTALYPDALYVHFPLAGDLDLVAHDLVQHHLRTRLPSHAEQSMLGIVNKVVEEFATSAPAERSAWVVVMRLFQSDPIPALENAINAAGLQFERKQYYGYDALSVYRVTCKPGAPLVAPPLQPAYDAAVLLKSWEITPPPDTPAADIQRNMALSLDDPPATLEYASNYVALGFIFAHRNSALAEATVRAGLRRFPDNGGLHFALAVVMLLQDQPDAAGKEFATAEPLLSSGAAPLFRRIARACSQGQFKEARDYFERMQALSGNILYDCIGHALERAATAAP
jgi:hypothetical protein